MSPEGSPRFGGFNAFDRAQINIHEANGREAAIEEAVLQGPAAFKAAKETHGYETLSPMKRGQIKSHAQSHAAEEVLAAFARGEEESVAGQWEDAGVYLSQPNRAKINSLVRERELKKRLG